MMLRLGRKLETRLRLAFLRKMPRLPDRYFHSRLTSDMAERCHSVQLLRGLPAVGVRLLRAAFSLALTTAGVIWLDPGCLPLAGLIAASSVLFPLLIQPYFSQYDMRLRTHGGALCRFYLDALLGLIPIRSHGAERSVRREHESLLVKWSRAGFGMQRAALLADGLVAVASLALAVGLLYDHFERLGQTGGALLLIYWTLNIPSLGQQIASFARQYPTQANVALRLMEPLGAAEDDDAPTSTAPPPASARNNGVSIDFRNVTVRAGGHEILENVSLTISPGSCTAIVGPSGAGKSSMLGLLLGWRRPAEGAVCIDGRPLDGAGISQLRRETAWVDPGVQLWNRPLIDNLRYGVHTDVTPWMSAMIAQADLLSVLERMPDGFQTALGEGGAFVSGGEGQRIRLGRAMLRRDARLVLLDEPFRGLDRERRALLTAAVRRWWPDATILFVTHDIRHTVEFDQVVVIETGRIVEAAPPRELAARTNSHYASVLRAEEDIRRGVWASVPWRNWWIDAGQLSERAGESN
jgi:ATP-binding cassette subfamily B protein